MTENSLMKLAISDSDTLFRKAIIACLDALPNVKVVWDTANGLESISILDKAAHFPDICIMALSMPVMNGYQTLQAMKDKWPELKIILLIRNPDEEVVIKAMRSGANAVLSKDSDLDALFKIVSNVHIFGTDYSNLRQESVQKALHTHRYKLPQLTDKEVQFMILCCSDLNYKMIANVMGVTYRAIDGYRDSLCTKLGIQNRPGIMMYAINQGIVPI